MVVMRILLAPDKFKGTLTAAEVCESLASGISASLGTVESVPIADGGDGTVAAAVAAGFASRASTVTGPDGRPVRAAWALSADGTAVLEMAEASGLALLHPSRLLPMEASSRGTGELVTAALDSGARRIVLGVGGSASTDGGTGMLSALGARFLDAGGCAVPEGGGGLAGIAVADLGGIDPRALDVDFIIATDVDNPLTGERGAAAVYGPQKGADPAQVATLDTGLAHLARLTGREDAAERPGAGAAGGLGFAAALIGAETRPGAGVVFELVGFDAALARADVVVTGEGRLDEQTFYGKGPGEVAARARRAGLEVWAVCGTTTLGAEEARAHGFAGVFALTDVEPDVHECRRRPGDFLPEVGARLAAALRSG